MATTLFAAVFAPAAPRARRGPAARCTASAAQKGDGQSAKAKPGWTEKATVAGGGYSGACDIEVVKQALDECAGLEGERLKACWASNGCDVEAVTEHYVKASGLKANN